MTKQRTTSKRNGPGFSTFIKIPDYEFQESVRTSLYPTELKFIKDEKGWNLNDLIRDGVKARLEEREKIKEIEYKIAAIERFLKERFKY